MSINKLKAVFEDARKSKAYSNYLEVRESVFEMLDRAQNDSDDPSDYWKEELDGFDYLLDASPLVVNKLREHCYSITGLRSYDYRNHHHHKIELFSEKLLALKKEDRKNMFVPESPLLGGFGHEINGELVNLDTLKFYESLIAMDKFGLLDSFSNSSDTTRHVVMEIGGGWGGFAYQFKTLFPNVSYVLVDLPQTILISATYLQTVFPGSSVFIYGNEPLDSIQSIVKEYDFIFIPHYAFKKAKLPHIDLAINTISFQEMTTGQVKNYVRIFGQLGCPFIYSHNRDRSPHNTQLTTVSSILSEFYSLTECKVLDVPYTQLRIPKDDKPGIPFQLARFLYRSVVPKMNNKRSIYEYRHYLGSNINSQHTD